MCFKTQERDKVSWAALALVVKFLTDSFTKHTFSYYLQHVSTAVPAAMRFPTRHFITIIVL